MSRLEPVEFSVVYADGAEPGRVENAFNTEQGWVAPPKLSYPIHLLLGLKSKANIIKITLNSHKNFVASQVDIEVGTCPNGMDYVPSNELVSQTTFRTVGTARFHPRSAGYAQADPKTVFVDCIAHFVRLIIHKCHTDRRNPENLVGLMKVEIFAYLIPERVQSKREQTEVADSNSAGRPPTEQVISSSREKSAIGERGGSSRQRAASSARSRSLRGTSKKSISRSGYSQKSEQLGEDPLTSVRTMRRLLRDRQALASKEGRLVEMSMCGRGCERLDEAEDDILALGDGYNDALVAREGLAVLDGWRHDMAHVRDVAFRAIHADLLLDKDQLRTFGVTSKWASAAGEDCEEEEEPRSRAVSQSVSRSLQSVNTEKIGRVSREGSVSGRNVVEQKEFRKNDRLADIQSRKEEEENSRKGAASSKQQRSFSVPATVSPNQCPFCDEMNDAFLDETRLNVHYIERCPVLSLCDYCHRVVEVQTLNEHWFTGRCPFVKSSLVPCPRCGQACSPDDLQVNKNHINCKNKMAPSGSEWCPLCSREVSPNHSKAAWKQHLIGDICYRNPRRHFSGVPDGVNRPTRIKKAKPAWNRPSEQKNN